MALTIKLKGVKEEIKVYTSISEIDFGIFVDFYKSEAKFLDHKKLKKNSSKFMTEAICHFDANYNKIELGNEDPKILFAQNFTIDAFTEEISRVRIYVHYLNLFNHYFIEQVYDEISMLDPEELSDNQKIIVGTLVNAKNIEDLQTAYLLYAENFGIVNYKNPNLSFDIEDETFYLTKDNVSNYFIGKDITTGEVSTIENLKIDLHEEKKSKGDATGAIDFTIGIKLCAVLCRKKGEVLPVDHIELEAFIDQRKELFKGLKMDVVYSVSFFLHNIARGLLPEIYMNTFGMGLKRVNQVELITQHG